MAIGIISALEAIEGNARPDDNSVVPPIDRLASLPQAFIMQMAQKGQIPKTMVAPVLAKKAENAQLGVQMQAAMQRAQTGGVPPSTVVEKVIAQNAAQEAAPSMDRSNVGIASAPMRPDMFRKAGGGIVAFSNGGLLEEYSKLPRFEYTDPVFEGQPLSKFFRRFKRPEGISSLFREKRVTPDGKVVSFGDYMRKQEQYETDIAKDKLKRGILNIMTEMSPESSYVGAVDESEGLPSGIDIEKYDEIANKREDIPGRRRGDGLTDITGTSKQVAADAPSGFEGAVDEGTRQVVADASSNIQNIADRVDEETREYSDQKESMTNGLQTQKDDADELDKIRQLFNLPERETDAEGKPLSLADRAKQILDQQKTVLGERPIYKKGKLSDEDFAMLGLELGLGLLGTKEQDFLTAAGQAGQPILKTALAKQKEIGERQLKESLAERAEKSAVLSDIQKEDRQVRAEERKFAKDLQLTGIKKEADYIIKELGVQGQITATDIQSAPKITKLAKEVYKTKLADGTMTLEEAVIKIAKQDILQKEGPTASARLGLTGRIQASADALFKSFVESDVGYLLSQAEAGEENSLEKIKRLRYVLNDGTAVDSPNKVTQYIQEERERINERAFSEYGITSDQRKTIMDSRFKNDEKTISFNKLLKR